MPALWGSVIAAGVGAYGASQDKKAQKGANQASQAQINQMLAMLGQPGQIAYEPGGPGTGWQWNAYGNLLNLYGKAEGQMQKSQGALTQGYQNALQAISQTGQGASQQIVQGGTKALEAQKAMLIQRGLAGTTGLAGLYRSNRADTSQQLTQLAGSLAPLRAQGYSQLGEAQSRGYTGLAALYQNQQQAESQLAQMRLATLGSVSHVAGPSFMDQLGGGQGLASLAGMFGSAFAGYGKNPYNYYPSGSPNQSINYSSTFSPYAHPI